MQVTQSMQYRSLAPLETLMLDAEIVVLGVVPSTVVASECRIFLQIFGDFIKSSTLNTANCGVGDEKFVLVFVDQVAVNFAGELRVFRGWRQLATRNGSFNLSEVVPWRKKTKKFVNQMQEPENQTESV